MTDDPDRLLYTCKGGARGDLEDVIYEGLDEDESDRLAGLERLLAGGRPEHRLHACAILAAWGAPGALRAIAGWAREPERAPWAGDPVTFERFGGADAAFELLARSLSIAQDARDRDGACDELRAEALRAMLASCHRVYTGRALYELMDLDPALRERVRDDLGPAVERSVAAARAGAAAFDLPTQTASLLGALAAVDDGRAARAAAALLADHPDQLRTHGEVAHALRHGTGAATLAVLDSLAASPHLAVRRSAHDSLGKRRPS